MELHLRRQCSDTVCRSGVARNNHKVGKDFGSLGMDRVEEKNRQIQFRQLLCDISVDRSDSIPRDDAKTEEQPISFC